jgi:hypothetical protein
VAVIAIDVELVAAGTEAQVIGFGVGALVSGVPIVKVSITVPGELQTGSSII